MNSRSNTGLRTSGKAQPKRTPRTYKVEQDNTLPSIITEPFNLKNIDLVGKIDDMRALTKELSIMARQLEQWVGIFYTVSMAFKDNGVLKDLLTAVSTVGSKSTTQPIAPSKKSYDQPAQQPFPFPFFGGGQQGQQQQYREAEREPDLKPNPYENVNIFDILNNPAFKEIISKLLLQPKK